MGDDMTGEVVLAGLQVPEGPTLLDGKSVAFTEQVRGTVSVFDGHDHDVLAYTGGSPNAVVAGADGALYVCQNGGVVGAWRSADPRTPSIQRVVSSGRVETVATVIEGHALTTPNDLVFASDGRLLLTDPAQPFDMDDRRDTGKIFALGADGGRLVAHPGPVYCNGIAVTPQENLMWVESYTRRVMLLVRGAVEATVLNTLPPGHVPDGMAVAEDGRVFIATCGSHGVDVVGPDGTHLGFLALDDSAYPSNVCFDGSTLIVTDFGIRFETEPTSGRLWRLDTDARGLPPHRGRISSSTSTDH